MPQEPESNAQYVILHHHQPPAVGLCRHHRAGVHHLDDRPAGGHRRHRPLEPELNRQIAIGVIYLIWFLCRLIPRLYSARFNSRLLLSNLRAAEAVPAEDGKRD